MSSVAIITIVKVEHIRDYVAELEDETRSNAETIAGGKSLAKQVGIPTLYRSGIVWDERRSETRIAPEERPRMPQALSSERVDDDIKAQ